MAIHCILPHDITEHCTSSICIRSILALHQEAFQYVHLRLELCAFFWLQLQGYIEVLVLCVLAFLPSLFAKPKKMLGSAALNPCRICYGWFCGLLSHAAE